MATAKTIRAMFRKRWSDLGYDVAIAPLYMGRQDDGFGVAPEELDESKIPRAEVWIGDAEKVSEYIEARVYESPAEIRVYHTDADELTDWLLDIEEKFDNSDRATTNPTEMDAEYGDVMGVRTFPQNSVPIDKNIVLGTVPCTVMWSKTVRIPS